MAPRRPAARVSAGPRLAAGPSPTLLLAPAPWALRVACSPLVVIPLLLTTSPLPAQLAPSPLDPHHWSYDLTETLAVRDPALYWPGAVRPVASQLIAEQLVEAAAGTEKVASLAAAWATVLAGPQAPARGDSLPRSGPRVSVVFGLGSRTGRAFLNPGTGVYAGTYLGAESGDLTVWGEYVGGGWEGFSGLRSGGITIRWSGLVASGGRQWFRAGPASDDLVLGGHVPFDAVSIATLRPLRLPVVGFLGPVSAQLALGPAGSFQNVEHTWFGFAALSVQPTRGMEMGAIRATRFEVDGSVWRVLGRVAGIAAGENRLTPPWEDHKLEIFVRLRGRPAGVPVASYVVLGVEGGTLFDDPGLVAGMLVPVMLSAGLTSFRYEYAGFGRHARWCSWCADRSRAWYQHDPFGDYSRSGIPVGHGLGGYGASHTLEAAFWASSGRLRGRTWLLTEVRDRHNILEPRWPGRRSGLGLELDMRVAAGLEVGFEAVIVDGPDVPLDQAFDIRFSWIIH